MHTAVVAPFVLNNSKRNEGLFQLLFTINAVRLNSFSFWLRVYEIPTTTTEKTKFRAYGIRSSLVLKIEGEGESIKVFGSQ